MTFFSLMKIKTISKCNHSSTPTFYKGGRLTLKFGNKVGDEIFFTERLVRLKKDVD